MSTVYLGIGTNLGDREANIQKALGFLKEDKEIEVQAVSSMIETDPVGGPPQGKFLNGAVKIRTDLLPLELLSRLKAVERRLGRTGSHGKNQPRPMDLDILLYDDVVFEGKNLAIPHPRLAERLFALEPLAEIAPDLAHPKSGRPIRELVASLRHEAPPQPETT
ncbi:MAG: 2-amino-4-hydroxy-6-hydroxymethyldihydropteridine diphosphokinase [Omnitrophica bacterium RIFCSPHIGHO2_02_FULL_63_14]|nr:MAG: 2-amino-4-hydroxy-6-hydroxymethyldihydropteridine diphosphokinase [Omnitrophica bacterium RIFCSPHIGHO2_02_FULL_63_14]